MKSFKQFRADQKINNVISAVYKVTDVPINEASVRDIIVDIISTKKASKLLEAQFLLKGEVKITLKDKLFALFGMSCKALFHIIAVVACLMYYYPIGLLLIGIWSLHNLAGVLYLKRYKMVQHQANVNQYGGDDD